MRRRAHSRLAAAGPLAIAIAFGCNSSETPVEPSIGGTTQQGGISNAGGLPSQVGGTSNGGTNPGEEAAGGTPSTGGNPSGGTSGGSTGTPGCNGNAAPPTSPSNGYLTIDVNGTSRTYVLELSSSYDGKAPQPVLFALHGTGTTAQEFLGSGYGDVRTGVARRAILVGPQGLSRSGQTGWMGNGGIEQVDKDFFDALVAQLKASYCIDPGRVFAMGHSAGAFFSNELGCTRSNVVRGVGPFNGGGPFGSCGGKVAAFIVHNPNDSWAGTGWPTTQFWTKQNGCNDPGAMPTAAFPGNSTTGNPLPCQAYAGCDPNYPVTLCLHSYSDQWDGDHAFAVQWGARAVTDFFLALPKVP
jgi:polyhydroxybutyrate depolymerase